jgi:hypothetical protein
MLAGGALTLAAAFGAIGYRVVSAQTATPNAPSTQSGSAQAGQPGPGRGMRDGVTEQGLADALGVTLQKLQTAEQAATSEALKEAVSAGLITQSQADQFAQGAQNGRPMGGLPFLAGSSIDYDALLAKALGISSSDLQSARQKAEFAALDQAVTDGRMTQAQADEAKGRYALTNNVAFQSAMKSAYEAAVKQAVTDGAITQSEADAILKNDAGPVFGGFGGRGEPGGLRLGGPGGPGPQGGWMTPGNPPTAAPSNGSGG